MEYYVVRQDDSDLLHKSSDKPEKTTKKTKFKYIKKVKVNGKWRYYYDLKDALGFDEQADYKSAKKSNKKAKVELEDRIIKRDMAYDTKKLYGKRLTTKDRAELTKYSDAVNKQIKNKSETAKKYTKAKKDFKKTPLGFFKITMPEKFDKGKDWIKKKFGKDTEVKTKKTGTEKKVKLPNGKTKVFQKIDEYKDYLKRLVYQKTEPEFMKKIPKIGKNKIFNAKEDMNKVNETYNPYNDRTSQNCANCSAAYELRRRGYDVEAKERDSEYNGTGYRLYDYFKNADVLCVNGDGSTFSQNKKWARKAWSEGYSKSDRKKYPDDYDFTESYQSYSADTITKAITKNNPPGSRGMIDVEWKFGGAHSIVYEVSDKGKVTIRDAQTYDEYSVDELANQIKKVRICRTDNLQLKKGILDAVVPNEDNERNYYMDKDEIKYTKHEKQTYYDPKTRTFTYR